jgi:uncharacterized protein
MTSSARLQYDCHVHLVGNGLAGSGCWMQMRGWHRMMGEMMRRMIGMPVGVTDARFDEIYVERLACWVQESSVDRVLLLAQDEVYDEQGVKRDFGSFHVPNDYLFAVCKRHEEFLPAVSIHPARKDALEELDRCLALGARCLKLLPNCHDVDCSDPRYDAFWEKMAAAGLPFLAHTGGEMTVKVANKAYEDPAILTRPLEIGVKVIAAHCASSSAFWEEDFFVKMVAMMKRFPNFYADTSALNTPFRSVAMKRALMSEMRGRMLHGSDYPVPVGAWYVWLRGLISKEQGKAAAGEENLIERDAMLKRMCGFDESHFTTLDQVLRPWP